MRLGGTIIRPESVEDMPMFAALADEHGISAITAPTMIAMADEATCYSFGQAARAEGLVIGETGFWENLITTDLTLRKDRLERLQKVIRNAEAMGCRSVAILAGTRDESDKAFAAHPYMFTDACRDELRGVIGAALDSFQGSETRLGLEPYAHSFFYQPDSAADFIESVGDPRFGIHLDLANMIAPQDFFATASLVQKAFDRLAPHIVSVHLKDLVWPVSPMGLAWCETDLGHGNMDFDAYLRAIAKLDPDMTCFCEHFPTQDDYFRNFGLAHQLARKAGVAFLPRKTMRNKK